MKCDECGKELEYKGFDGYFDSYHCNNCKMFIWHRREDCICKGLKNWYKGIIEQSKTGLDLLEKLDKYLGLVDDIKETRTEFINNDDITNLKIALETSESLEQFLERV